LALGATLVVWATIAVLGLVVLEVVVPVFSLAIYGRASSPLVSSLGGTVIGVVFGSGTSPPGLQLIRFAIAVVWALGWWLLSDPGQAQRLEGLTVRRWLRAILLATLGIHAVELTGSLAGITPAFILGQARGIAFGARFFLSMALLSELARRMPDPALEKSAKQFMWLGPLVFIIGVVACLTGPIIATGMYISLVDRARFDLKRVVSIVRRGVPELNPPRS
jgi:hypothetical protein